VDVLLLFPHFLLSRGRQVVVCRVTGAFLSRGQPHLSEHGDGVDAYQVMISPLADVAGLDAQVLERLGRLVNDLVVELALDLVGRHDVPPKQAVDQTSSRLQDALGHVNVAAPLEDFAVDQLGDLGRRVVLGAVQLKGLGRRLVVVQDLLERLTDIDDLLR